MVTTTTGLATSFITFSRPGASGAGATVTDRDGRIKWAGHNLLTNSESFDASAWVKSNSGSTDPVVTANNASAPNSTTTADKVDFGAIDASTDYSFIYQQFTSVDGVYTVGFWVKAAAAGDVGKKLYLSFWNTATAGLTTVTLTADWQYITTSATLTAGSSRRVDLATLGSNFGGANQAATSAFLWGAHLYRSDLGGMQHNPAMPAGMQSYYPTTVRNALGWTEDFANAYWTNSATTVTLGATTAPNGLQTANKIVATATLAFHARYVIISLGSAVYTLSVYAKAAEYSLLHVGDRVGALYGAAFDLASGTVVAGTTGGTKYVSSAISPVGNGWYRCSIVFSNPATSVGPTFVGYPAGATLNNIGAQYTGDGTSGIYLWGAQLSDSASLDTYVPVYGAAVTSAAYYAPRLDYDGATLAAKGLLVEEQRTNFLKYSNDFTQTSVWTMASTGSVAVNATTAPDGTSTAQKIKPASNGSSSGLTYDNLAGVFINGRTVSFYIKAGEITSVKSQNGAGEEVTMNLSTGVITGNAVYTNLSMVNVGGSWWRVSYTYNTSGGTSFYLGATSGADGTNGFFLYGAQLEAGSFSTSLIPTGSATATRAADVASVSTQAFPYSSSAGTLVANMAWLAGTAEAANNRIGVILQETSTKYTTMYNGGGKNTIYVRDGASDQFYAELTASAANTPVKVGLAYASNDFAGTMNGGAVTPDASGTPTNASMMYLGNFNGSTLQMNGHIRQITYLPRRISNAELQSRTA